jgi:hypothetical protein
MSKKKKPITVKTKSKKELKEKDKHFLEYDEFKAFWNDVLYRMPRFNFPIAGGGYKSEYLPRVRWKLTGWLYTEMLVLRLKLGIPVYYWQTRYIYDPYLRKRYDLMFAAHVIYDHDGVPDSFIERVHYRLLKLRYGQELDYFREALWLVKNGEKVYFEEYAQAYVDKWIIKPYAEMTTLYHGLAPLDFFEFRDYEEYYLNKRLRSAYAKRAAQVRWEKEKSEPKREAKAKSKSKSKPKIKTKSKPKSKSKD